MLACSFSRQPPHRRRRLRRALFLPAALTFFLPVRLGVRLRLQQRHRLSLRLNFLLAYELAYLHFVLDVRHDVLLQRRPQHRMAVHPLIGVAPVDDRLACYT